jgi:hypothetical protein
LSYKNRIKPLIQLVDDNYRHPTRMDEFKTETMILWMVLIIVSLFGFVIYLMWTIPLVNWLPIGVSFAALMIASNVGQTTLFQKVRRRWLLQELDRLFQLSETKTEEVKHLLLPIIAMKQKNHKMTLTIIYQISPECFDKKNLLEFYSAK